MTAWILVSLCKECGLPTQPVNLTSWIGYNTGHDGHMYTCKQEALDHLENTKKAFTANGVYVNQIIAGVVRHDLPQIRRRGFTDLEYLIPVEITFNL